MGLAHSLLYGGRRGKHDGLEDIGSVFAAAAESGCDPSMHIKRGIKLLEESQGEGRVAGKGDRVVYNVRIFLNKGDEVPLNNIQAEHLPPHMIRVEGDHRFIDHTVTLGKREAMAAVEYSLMGMKEGGYRKVRASPHLTYREKGIPGLIPANAVLVLELWLRSVNSDS